MNRGFGLEHTFPNLKPDNYRVTSPQDTAYNCIAWAAGDSSRWWWPSPYGGSYWPSNVPKSDTLEIFILAFEQNGYEQCEDTSFEEGYEKVAIYVDNNREPTHAARQLVSGEWTSKLADGVDIQHQDPTGVEGELYGSVAAVLRRRRE